MRDDWVNELQELARLRRANDLSDQEFTRRKAELLGLPASEPKISLPDSKPEAARPELGETNQVKRTPYRLGLLARVVMGCHTAHVLLLFFLIVWTYNFEIRGNYNFHYWLATAVVQLVLMATSTVFCYRAWYNSLHFGYFRPVSEADAWSASFKWLFWLGGKWDRLWYPVAVFFWLVVVMMLLESAFGSQRQARLVDELLIGRHWSTGTLIFVMDWWYVLAVLMWSVAGFFTIWRIATAHDQRTDT
jgi:hypothetical protein